MSNSLVFSVLFFFAAICPTFAVSTVSSGHHSQNTEAFGWNSTSQENGKNKKQNWWKRSKSKVAKAVQKTKAFFGKLMSNDKSQLAAALFAFFLGILGVHRFYLGYPVIGIIYIFTLGIFGLGPLIDFIRIVIGDLKPKHGEYVKKEQ